MHSEVVARLEGVHAYAVEVEDQTDRRRALRSCAQVASCSVVSCAAVGSVTAASLASTPLLSVTAGLGCVIGVGVGVIFAFLSGLWIRNSTQEKIRRRHQRLLDVW